MNERIIPTHADSYDTLNFVHTKCVSVYKKVGYTPLQVVEDIRPFLLEEEKSRITYVGRLDPMAEGWMHVLWSGDVEEKKKLSSLRKTYEVDVVFNIQTDTGDALGLVISTDDTVISQKDIEGVLKSFIGPFVYAYPAYSSPHIKKTRQGSVSEVKNQKGYIHTIDVLSCISVTCKELQNQIEEKLSLARMPGDFRIDTIQKKWKKICIQDTYTKVTLRVVCDSGTYMRTLAEEIAKKISTHGFAFSIKRIGVHI
jgi:tRNA pseudouridine55 synthase